MKSPYKVEGKMRRTMGFALMVALLSLGAISGCGSSNDDNDLFGSLESGGSDGSDGSFVTTDTRDPDKWLYVQTAATAQMTSDNTLEIPITRDIFAFSDRPNRDTRYVTGYDFATYWGSESPDSFSKDAPNAVLTWVDGEEQREVLMILNKATFYTDGVTENMIYDIDLGSSPMPDAQMSDVSLFVDDNSISCATDHWFEIHRGQTCQDWANECTGFRLGVSELVCKANCGDIDTGQYCGTGGGGPQYDISALGYNEEGACCSIHYN